MGSHTSKYVPLLIELHSFSSSVSSSASSLRVHATRLEEARNRGEESRIIYFEAARQTLTYIKLIIPRGWGGRKKKEARRQGRVQGRGGRGREPRRAKSRLLLYQDHLIPRRGEKPRGLFEGVEKNDGREIFPRSGRIFFLIRGPGWRNFVNGISS